MCPQTIWAGNFQSKAVEGVAHLFARPDLVYCSLLAQLKIIGKIG